MKTAQRHQLKTNEVAEQLARVTSMVAGRERQIGYGVVAIIAALLIGGGLWTWRQRASEGATAALAEAMAIAQAEVIPADSSRPPTPGTYASEEARAEAAVAKFRAVIAEAPSSDAATTARYEAAALLASIGKAEEAEQYFREVASNGSGLHARMAKMGLAELQVRAGKYDEAIATYRDLSSRKDDDLPVDGVLMQLGRAYQLAGKRAEALQTYQRIVSEFPDSLYAGEAEEAAGALKAAGGAAS